MSRINNSFHLIGHLGAAPDIRYNPKNGEPIGRLALAVNNYYRDKNTGERIERVDWFDLTVYFKGLVEVVEQYCHKGTQIAVRGHLRKRVWESKDRKDADGKPLKESRMELIVSELQLLGRPKEASKAGEADEAALTSQSGYLHEGERDEGFDEDLPF